MFDQQAIIDQVLRNCDISDAQFSGNYSVCGLFLRLRDLYKWEKGLDSWIEKESIEILDWIDAKEELWDALPDENLEEMNRAGKRYDPFEAPGTNEVLDQAVSAGHSTARYHADAICEIHSEGKRRGDSEWAKLEMKKRLLNPLGI